jgi:ATP-binding cassette, subfamily A (ABC1), member 3
LFLKQANGQLRCLGSAQHLKSKFGKGYQLEVKVRHVNRDDTDFVHNMTEMLEQYHPTTGTVPAPTTTTLALLQDNNNSATTATALMLDDCDNHITSAMARPEQIYFDVDEAKLALERLTGDTTISCLVEANDPIGYSVWKEATTSPLGIDLSTLAAFATCELRMCQLENFIDRTFPKHILRERQDTKARYEVDCDGIKISSIFASIEENKDNLRLEDYCVSQTSLEQVFNMHAAEAERLKVHQVDG